METKHSGRSFLDCAAPEEVAGLYPFSHLPLRLSPHSLSARAVSYGACEGWMQAVSLSPVLGWTGPGTCWACSMPVACLGALSLSHHQLHRAVPLYNFPYSLAALPLNQTEKWCRKKTTPNQKQSVRLQSAPEEEGGTRRENWSITVPLVVFARSGPSLPVPDHLLHPENLGVACGTGGKSGATQALRHALIKDWSMHPIPSRPLFFGLSIHPVAPGQRNAFSGKGPLFAICRMRLSEFGDAVSRGNDMGNVANGLPGFTAFGLNFHKMMGDAGGKKKGPRDRGASPHPIHQSVTLLQLSSAQRTAPRRTAQLILGPGPLTDLTHGHTAHVGGAFWQACPVVAPAPSPCPTGIAIPANMSSTPRRLQHSIHHLATHQARHRILRLQ